MMALTAAPPGRSITTSALTLPRVMRDTVPHSRLRADSLMCGSGVVSSTEGALTSAQTSLPGASWSSDRLSMVIMATRRSWSFRVIVTSAFTEPTRMPVTVPKNWLRALVFTANLLMS